MKQQISAIVISLFIICQFLPQVTGSSQVLNDSVVNPENQILFKMRDEMVDSIKSKTGRVTEKQRHIKVEEGPEGLKVVYIHDTVYLPLWKSLIQVFKRKKQP